MSVLIFYGGLRTYNNNVIGLAVCISVRYSSEGE